MKLPNGDQAIVEVEKLTGYCLSPDHPRGKHKAKVFASALGLTADQAAMLQAALLLAAVNDEASTADNDGYGQRHVVDFTMEGPEGTAGIRSSWIVRTDEDFPRLSSCFVM